MALEGTLATLSFSDVVQLLGATQKTGVLVSERAGAGRKLYLKSGNLVAVSSSDPGGYIGNTLVALGKVTDEQLLDAVRRQPRESKLVGLLLVEAGALSEDVLRRYLADKAYEVAADLLDWTDARFRFEEFVTHPLELVPLDLPVGQLLLEGARRLDELSRLRKLVPSDAVLIERTGGAVTEPAATGQTLVCKVLRSLDRPRTVAELRTTLRTSDYALLNGLTALLDMGAVETREPDDDADEPWLVEARNLLGLGDVEAAIRLLRRGLDREPPSERARALLAEAEQRFTEETTRDELPLEAVPRPLNTMEALLERSLSPTEAFLLSRIDGYIDVADLLAATPLPEPETLTTLRRLVRGGYLELSMPEAAEPARRR